MRILTANMLAVAALLFGATSAGAFALNMIRTDGGGSAAASGSVRPASFFPTIVTSDSVVVEVYLDADAGLTILSVAVLYTSPGLTYDPVASAALTPVVATLYGTGAVPSYILYSPSTGRALAQWLYPVRSPPQTWPGDKPPGFGQVNIDFRAATRWLDSETTVTGNGIWIASLLFHVEAGFGGGGSLELAFTSSNVLRNLGGDVPPSDIGLSQPISLAGFIPEPATGALIGLGILGLAVAARRSS